jgi:hypothetical protein
VAGKYYKRFYTHPIFAQSTVLKMKDYSGYYLVVDFPEIDKTSNYWEYLQSCAVVDRASSGRVGGYVYDCKLSDKTKL